jgi:hypothetical protein
MLRVAKGFGKPGKSPECGRSVGGNLSATDALPSLYGAKVRSGKNIPSMRRNIERCAWYKTLQENNGNLPRDFKFIKLVSYLLSIY